MALTLNLTLLVQMIHFIGAYLFISRYLLKPGYAAVKEDNERDHQIRSAIVHEQNQLAQRSLHKDTQWKACQEQFMLKRPALEKELPSLVFLTPIERPPMPSEEEIKKVVREVSTVVKDRVLHV